jgi:hypothetical protein
MIAKWPRYDTNVKQHRRIGHNSIRIVFYFLRFLFMFSRLWVKTNGVWIGDSIYLTR